MDELIIDVLDASQIGLKPGEWPATIVYQGQSWSKHEMSWFHDELVAVIYAQFSYGVATRTVHVLND